MEAIDLSEFFKTKAEANDFASRLATVSEKIYQNGFSLEKALLEQFGVTKKDKFITLLRDNKINTESTSDLKGFLSSLIEKIGKIPILELTVAFEPDEQTLVALSEWFILNTKKQVLFAITVDRKLIAGAAITVHGKFLDFSIRPKFEEVISKIIDNKNQKPSTDPEKTTTPTGAHQSIEHITVGR